MCQYNISSYHNVSRITWVSVTKAFSSGRYNGSVLYKCWSLTIEIFILTDYLKIGRWCKVNKILISLESYHTFSRLECKCKLWGKRGHSVTQYGVTICCSSHARASGSPTGITWYDIFFQTRKSHMRQILPRSWNFVIRPVHTCPCHWYCLVAVVLVLLWCSV